MREERDGRPHAVLGGQRDQHIRLWWTLDQYRPRARRFQGRPHGPRRTGPVVPHPEQQGTRTAPGAFGPRGLGKGSVHALTSRQAR